MSLALFIPDVQVGKTHTRLEGHLLEAELGGHMLYWAAVFFIIAIIAAIFGFGGIAGGAATIAQVLFFAFVVLFLVSLIAGLIGGRRVTQ